MTLGGVPHYLKEIKAGKSAVQNIDEICFSPSGLLRNEFERLYPFGKKKKDLLYRLTDEYSLFYLQFMENKKQEGAGTWQHLSQTQSYKTWSGYAFENICLKHIPEIKKALGISGVYSLLSSFYKKGTATEPGAQIDLLIDRNDQFINLFEIFLTLITTFGLKQNPHSLGLVQQTISIADFF